MIPKRQVRRASRTVARWLIFCFPVGLLMMWSERCRWNRAIKSAVSLGFVVLLLMLVLPQTRAPGQSYGGVEIVSLEAVAEKVGPTMRPDAQRYEVYTPKYIPKTSVLAEPTPTPVPYWVYCNDGGKYYHMKKCRFVKPTTPKVTLIQANNAGFKSCKECKPPKAEDMYDWDQLA